MNTAECSCATLSAKDAARLLGISERHFWSLLAEGKLGPQPISLGRSKRWLVSELHDWLERGAPCREQWQQVRRAHPEVSHA